MNDLPTVKEKRKRHPKERILDGIAIAILATAACVVVGGIVVVVIAMAKESIYQYQTNYLARKSWHFLFICLAAAAAAWGFLWSLERIFGAKDEEK